MTSTPSAPGRHAPGRASGVLKGPAWYLHRLRSMSARELPFRLVEQARRTTGRLSASAVRDAGPRTPIELADLVVAWRVEPHVRDFWREEAARVVAGDVRAFGVRWPATGTGVPDWELDPLTGYRWPDTYCFDVPLTPDTDRPAEVKYVWEVNRLLYLLPVAAHAATAGDSRAAATCRAHLEAWIRAHPPGRGVAWRSGIELAIRVLTLVVVLELLDHGGESDAALERLVGGAVAEHVDWLERFPSRYSSANNHRVAELAGLVLAAGAYPQVATARELDGWWREFDLVARRQFHRDGVPAEQASMYGLFVLELIALCLHLGRGSGRVVSPATRERLKAAAGFAASVVDLAGQPVRFGDDDEATLLTAARPRGDLPATVLALLARELGSDPPPAPTGLATFADGGYTVWRSAGPDEVLWVLDHGRLGMGSLAAHGHADTLAVYLHYGGSPVFVDAGTYLYHAAGRWRDDLRSTAVHNTLLVNGTDSSTPAGPFNWRRSPRARGRLVSLTCGDPGWAAEVEHDGYVGRHGVTHRRSLESLSPSRFRLTDRLEGDCTLPVRWSLLLAPGLVPAPLERGWLICQEGRPIVRIDTPPGWRTSLRSGEKDGAGGWHSPSFGRLVPTHQLIVDGDLGCGGRLEVDITLLAPPSSPQQVPEEVS